MRAKRVLLAMLVVVTVVANLAIVPPAAGEEEGALSTIPYGKYTGSAIGSKEGSKPFEVTLYVDPAADGQVELTGRTPALPIPVSVKGTPTRVAGGWDIAVSVSMNVNNRVLKLELNGSGVVRLRERDGKQVFYASGSGSYNGDGGSGRASGTRAGESSLVDQIGGALGGFISGGDSDAGSTSAGGDGTEGGSEATSTVPVPEEYVEPGEEPEAGTTSTGAEPAGEDTVMDDPPLTFDQLVELLTLLILLLVLGFF